VRQASGFQLAGKKQVQHCAEMTHDFRVLIVGGYGTFGGRVVELLEDEPRLTLLVAGRSLPAAQAYCETRRAARAQLIPVAFDRTTANASLLGGLRPAVLVDASGPFQAYGPHGYALVEVCVACGVHYLDLADGSAFVAGIAQFDAAARAAGVFVLSGVSSFPVLTSAVVHRLATGMSSVHSIHGGIAPSPYAGVGLNVIRAIASYSGQPIALRRRGASGTGWPFAESELFVVAVPGQVPLRRSRFSLVDVPDLQALPDLWPQAEVWMGAAPVPPVLHWALIGFAWLVRLRLLRNLSWLSRAMHLVTEHVRWGEHRGGMYVVVAGSSEQGHTLVREWHLLAEGDDGPLIPSMAVEAVVRSILDSRGPPAGARTAIADVDLDDYEKLFARRTIYTGIRVRAPAIAQPLFRRILGDAWNQLPAAVQRLHSVAGRASFRGTCTVSRGRNPLGGLLATLIGFPISGVDQDISVELTVDSAVERWVRIIGGHRFSSILSQGTGHTDWLLRERFGPVKVDIALVLEGSALHYIIRGWTLFGVRLPRWLGPRSTAVESSDDGQFRFDVSIGHPLTGMIIRYDGVLRDGS
jgi:hypothetical protein